MAPIRLDVSALTGMITQAILYGIFQVLFVACVYVLVTKRSNGQIHWPLLCTSIIMWFLIGMNLALSWSRIMDAFIFTQPELAQNPNAINDYFNDVAKWKEVFRSVDYLVLTAVADTLFIYRLYIVWGQNKFIIIVPMILLVASTTCAIAIAVVLSTESGNIFASNLGHWAKSFFSISLVQNVLTTLLIILRIWYVNRRIQSHAGNSLWPVMAILLESGAIYSSALLVLLTTYESNSFAQYIAIDMLVPIIGITFTLIIVRIGLGISHDRKHGATTGTKATFSNNVSLRKVSINVSKQVTVDHDDLENNGKIDLEDDSSDTQPNWNKGRPAAF